MSSLQSEKLTDQRMLPGYAAGHDGRDGSNRVLRARAPGERTTGVHRNLTFPARLGVSRSGILVMPHQLRRMIMETRAQAMSSMPRREPWNKDKLIGQKPPLRPKHVWSIRTRLQMEGRTRDLAMFNLTIDSKLRGCDVVALRVEDVAPSGYAVDRATVRQKKTGRPVRFELTEQTRQAVDDYIKAVGKKPGESVHWPWRSQPLHDDPAICAARLELDSNDWPQPALFRHAPPSTYQSDTHLPSNRQLIPS